MKTAVILSAMLALHVATGLAQSKGNRNDEAAIRSVLTKRESVVSLTLVAAQSSTMADDVGAMVRAAHETCLMPWCAPVPKIDLVVRHGKGRCPQADGPASRRSRRSRPLLFWLGRGRHPRGKAIRLERGTASGRRPLQDLRCSVNVLPDVLQSCYARTQPTHKTVLCENDRGESLRIRHPTDLRDWCRHFV